MKYIAYLIASNIVALTLACIAGYMVYADKQGWGWFLFGTLLAAVTPTKQKEN